MIGHAETGTLYSHIISVLVISKRKYLFPKYVHVIVKADAKKLSEFSIYVLAILPALFSTYIMPYVTKCNIVFLNFY